MQTNADIKAIPFVDADSLVSLRIISLEKISLKKTLVHTKTPININDFKKNKKLLISVIKKKGAIIASMVIVYIRDTL